jgi:transcription initiation factor TFIIIB Brf1 subunit/transcription initiation factor TFIIB
MEEVEFSETEFERYGKLLERKNKTIEEVVRGLGLPEEVEKLANELFKRYKMSGKRACVSTIIASVALASRIYGFAIPFRKIIEEVGVKVSRRALLRSLSSMRMGGGVEWDSYLNYALMKVGRDLPPLVRERLMVNAKKEMVRILRKRELVLGRNPIQIVAVAIYFAARRIGLRISMREIALSLGVSESSVYRVKGLIEDG